MFNQELHDKWLSNLKKECDGRRVLLVGNSIKLFGKEYGELIDSYDFVVRLGKGLTTPQTEVYNGSRTDCWISGLLRVNCFSHFQSVKYKILMYNPLTPNSDLNTINMSRAFFSKSFQIYKDYFTVGSINDVADITEFPIKTVERPSAGYVAANFFLKRVQTFKSFDVIGFDFFESKISYMHNNTVNEVSSYHIPIPIIKGSNSNPHVNGPDAGQEKKFFLNQEALGNITIHKMDTLPTEKTAQMLMSIFREDGKLIELK